MRDPAVGNLIALLIFIVTIGAHAVVLLYGTGAQWNNIEDNLLYDGNGNTTYGVYEWNNGGMPSNNKITGNMFFGIRGAAVSKSPTTSAVCATDLYNALLKKGALVAANVTPTGA